MRGQDLIKTIYEQRNEKHSFVKWWRKENDFLDYDLLDRFLDNSSAGEEIGGVELLTLDDMWREVKRIGGERVKLLHDMYGDRVQWVHKVKTGERTDYCAYSPATLMAIFDVETGGNPVGM